MYVYGLSRTWPERLKKYIAEGVRQELGPDYDMAHFTPRYNPWDQRLCLVPDADLFRAIRGGRASVVTDQIETFTERGLQLRSGAELEADIIVTATGLILKLMAGLELVVDNQVVDLAKTLCYKGMMYSDVPNLAQCFGYTNASWTLKCDLTAEYVCRLLKHMDEHGHTHCVARRNDPTIVEESILDFTSGYVQRALHTLPKQGSRPPWRLHQNYVKDVAMLRFGGVSDSAMEFQPYIGNRLS
jgi:cation diffusion facilitator CzcD-associated flavoprotein CzcO